jgi:hypothetical protein
MKKIWIILILVLSLLPTYKIYAQTSNVGFVPGNMWYSVDPFEEGDKIKIYTVVFNPDKRELSGTVVLFDNNVFLGKQDFIAEAQSVKDVSVDWTVTAGDHSIFGKIENAKFLVSKGVYEEVYLAENETSKSLRTVNKKVVAKMPDTTEVNTNPNSILSSVSAAGSDSIKNIEKIIGKNTPDFIAQPMVLGASTVENFRQDISTSSENKKGDIQAQIKALDANKKNNTKTAPGSQNTEDNKFLKPFKYAELFFFTFLSFIINNKLIFYGSLVFIIFLILRFVWHLIF